MKVAIRSQGAQYVRTLPRWKHFRYTEERKILLWSPTCSLYVNEDGVWREVWGLERSDAVAMCRVHKLRFREAVFKHRGT